MAQGFYTVERWTRREPDVEPEWVVVEHLDGRHLLSDALKAVDDLGVEGFYRVVQTQRMVRLEAVKDGLKSHRHHAMTPEVLDHFCKAYS